MQILKQLLRDEEGQGMVEYGIIIALISIVAIGVISSIGKTLNSDTKGYGWVSKELDRLPVK